MTHQQVQFEKPAQASSRAEVEQQKTVLFHIEVVNTKTGRRERQTAYPMTEKECSVMVSKMTAYPWRTVELVPAEAPAGIAVSDSTRRRKSSYSSPALSDRAASE